MQLHCEGQILIKTVQGNHPCLMWESYKTMVPKTSLGNEWVVLWGSAGFRQGYSCESQVVTVCQDIIDSQDEGVRTDAIITDFSNAFDLVPHDRLLKKITTTGVHLRVVV